jgi:hypothetical protein
MTEVKVDTLYEMAADIDILLRDCDFKLETARDYLQLLKNNLEKIRGKE